jgi:hypothetical protein
LQNDLIDRIQVLSEDIAHRQIEIEEGTFEDNVEDYDGYYEVAPEDISEDQQIDLENLFIEADQLFLANELKLAAKAYRLLLKMFRSDQYEEEGEGYYDEEDETLFSEPLSGLNIRINWRETRSRFARCVYETTTDLDEKARKMLYAMEINAEMFQLRYAPSEEAYPFLHDVYNAKEGEMPQWRAFLELWTLALEKKTNKRAYILYLEAIYELNGMQALAEQVQKYPHPLGYLYWMDRLSQNNAWHDVSLTAQEALLKIPFGVFRTQTAEILAHAGHTIKDNTLILKGIREQFHSDPGDYRLALLIEEASRQNIRNQELEQLLTTIDSDEHIGFRIKILLMLGRIDEAIALLGDVSSLGWSYGDTGVGVFFGGVLTALTRANPQAVMIQNILKRYTQTGYSYEQEDEKSSHKMVTKTFLYQELIDGLKTVSMTETQKQRWLAIALTLGKNRIEAIVSNRHRHAYNRAAEALGALMECYLLNNQKSESLQLLALYKDEKYGSYQAFRSEVTRMMEESELLNPLLRS